MTRKGYRRAKIALSVFLAFFLLLFCFATGLMVASAVVDRSARRIPSYAREDITGLTARSEWTEEDYRTIYLQTGLGRSAADALKEAGNAADLVLYQDELFFAGEVRHEYTVGTVTTLHDLLFETELDENGNPAKDENGDEIKIQHRAKLAPLEEGDVIVTSSCHTFGWRNGHAVIVTDASRCDVLESMALGMKSQITPGGATWFADAANFIVLRLKGAAREERATIAERAKNELLDVDYSLTVGILSAKNQCKNGKTAKGTNCAHLVWQAYKNCGYDIDSNGGPLCTVRDIARSDLFEVVQVYGFDPQKLW